MTAENKPGRGRPSGTRNKKHTSRTAQVTLRIDPEILAEWRALCEFCGMTMSARFEQLMRQDVNHDQAVGTEQDQAAIFPPKSVTHITARIERVEGGKP